MKELLKKLCADDPKPQPTQRPEPTPDFDGTLSDKTTKTNV